MATARRGGRQAAAANLRVGTAAVKDDNRKEPKSEEVKTPVTAASDQTAQTDNKRSPTLEKLAEKGLDTSPGKPGKTEDPRETKDETERMDQDPPAAVKAESPATDEPAKMEDQPESRAEIEKMNEDSPVIHKPGSPTIDLFSKLPEDIATKPSFETEVGRGISRSESIKAEARKRSEAMSYPDSDGESELNATQGKRDPSSGPAQADAEDMEMEQDVEPYLSERFSTERIRHTSPISARVLQNVRALKEEILNGNGGGSGALSGAPSFSSNPDDNYLTSRQERSSSLIAPASTEVSASTSFDRPTLATRDNDRSKVEARKSRFSSDNQSANVSATRAQVDIRGLPKGANVPERLAGKEPEIISGVKRAMDVARSFGLDNPRNFKRQRHISPARSRQGSADAGGQQAQGSRWQANNRPDLYRPNARLADQNGASRPQDGPRGSLQSDDSIPARPLDRAPAGRLPGGNDSSRVSEENRERERSPPRRQSRWDQPARGANPDNRDRTPQNGLTRTLAGNSGLNHRPFSSPPRPSKFSPATAQTQQTARTGASSYSPSVAAQQRIHPDRLQAHDLRPVPPSAQIGDRAQTGSFSVASNPPVRQPLAVNPGRGQQDAGYPRNSQIELPSDVSESSRDRQQNVKTDALPPQAVGHSRDTPPRPEALLPEKPRMSRFSAAPAGPVNSNRSIWNAPATGSFPSLTAANLGRNMAGLPESHGAPKTFSRVSDDGRSALSEARVYVALPDHLSLGSPELIAPNRVPLMSPGTDGEPGRRRPPGSAALREELDARRHTQGAPRFRYIGHVDAERDNQGEAISRDLERDLRNSSVPSLLPPSNSSTMHSGLTSIRSSGVSRQSQEPYSAYDSPQNRNDPRTFGYRGEGRNNFNAIPQRQDVPRDDRDVPLPRFTPASRSDQPHALPGPLDDIRRFDDRGPVSRRIEDPRALRQHELGRSPSQNSSKRLDCLPDESRSFGYDGRAIDNLAPARRRERAGPPSGHNPPRPPYADERYRHEPVDIPRLTSSLVEQELAAMKQKIADLERLRALELSVYGAAPVVPIQRIESPPVRRPSNGYDEGRDAGRFDAARDPPFRHSLDSRDQGNTRDPVDMSGHQPHQVIHDSRGFRGGRDIKDVRGPVSHLVPSHGPRFNDQQNAMGPRRPVNGSVNESRHGAPTSLSGRVEMPRNFDSPKATPPSSRINDTRAPIRESEQIHEERRMPQRDARSFDDRAPLRPPLDEPHGGPGQTYRNVPPNQQWDRRNPAELRGGPPSAENQNFAFRPGYPAQSGRR